MAGTTISGSYTTSVTLSMPATQNPATISGTGRINVTATSGSALYGTKAAAWAVYNYGTVIGPTYGAFLAAGGVVSNGSTGLITGGYRGVEINGAPGSISNAGSIGGGKQQGVRLAAAGSVTNLSGGTITAAASYASVYILHGGTVSNASGGTFSGGVQIYDAGGTVTNAGVINSGSLSAYGMALLAGGSITNSGTVRGNTIGIKGNAATSVPLYISNQAGGYIGGGSLAISGSGLTIVNAGDIKGKGIQLIGGGVLRNTGHVVSPLPSPGQ